MSLAALLGATLGSGRATEGTHAKIPFQFTVERISLPAGEYDFIPNADNRSIRVVPVGKGQAADALVVTRMAAAMHTTPKDAHIVFDKVGETYILSEIRFPESDGFLLHATKEKHEHKVLSIPS